MNASEMTDAIAFMEAVAPPIADRIKRAGARGFAWPLRSHEFFNRGYSHGQMQAFANVSALAACEMQCVVEAWSAERRGGIHIKC